MADTSATQPEPRSPWAPRITFSEAENAQWRNFLAGAHKWCAQQDATDRQRPVRPPNGYPTWREFKEDVDDADGDDD